MAKFNNRLINLKNECNQKQKAICNEIKINKKGEVCELET